MITIGLDLSLTATGVVLLKDGKLYKKFLIKTKPDVNKNHLNELKRLMLITKKIEDIISDDRIDVATIEGLSFMARNSTALIQLSGLNYFIRKLLYEHNIPFYICAPTSLKKYATGKGNGPKDIIMMTIYKRYGVTLTDNNLADAFILAHIADALKRDVKLTIPQKEVITLLKSK